MEPLFENRILLDREVLLEWYGHELGKNRRMNTLVHLGFTVVYVVAAVSFAVFAVLMHMPLLWLFCALFLLCAVAFLANWLLRCRFQVWLAMRRDKGNTFGREYVTRFYPQSILAMKNADDLPDLPRLQRQLDEAQRMQKQVELLMQQMDGEEDGEARVLLLQAQLQALSSQMEEMERDAQSLNSGGWHGYDALQAVEATDNLYIITVEGQTVLVNKDGFSAGYLDEFDAFIMDKLQKAGGETDDPVQRRSQLRQARRAREEKEKSAGGTGDGRKK